MQLIDMTNCFCILCINVTETNAATNTNGYSERRKTNAKSNANGKITMVTRLENMQFK